jgi:hypothetical protein
VFLRDVLRIVFDELAFAGLGVLQSAQQFLDFDHSQSAAHECDHDRFRSEFLRTIAISGSGTRGAEAAPEVMDWGEGIEVLQELDARLDHAPIYDERRYYALSLKPAAGEKPPCIVTA